LQFPARLCMPRHLFPSTSPYDGLHVRKAEDAKLYGIEKDTLSFFDGN